MPVVPYKPVPDVAISQQGIQGINVPTPIAAFGGSIAEAISSAGKTVERAGDEIFQRAIALKQLENETEAREADAEYTIQLGTLEANYRSMEGKNAVAGYPKYQEDVRRLQQDYSSRMTNPMSKRIFDRESRGNMARTIFRGAGHAAMQNRRWAEGVEVANEAAAADMALRSPDPNTFNAAVGRARTAAIRRGDLNGWSDEQTTVASDLAVSKVYMERIRGIAQKDPFEARRFFDENRDKIRGVDLDNAERVVQTNLYRVGSLRIASEVNDQPVEGGENLETRLERAERKAKELVPDDPTFHQYVKDQTITQYNRMRGVRQEVVQERRNVIESALIGGLGDGKIPSSPDELMSLSPEAKAAWESLRPQDQRRYMSIMAKNSKGDVSWTPERLREMEKLKGMAHTDPAAFMSRDLAAEDLPLSARKQLLDLRVALAKRSGGDPRLSAALTMLRPMLRSAGIMPDQDKDRYQQFVGGLLDAMADFNKANPGKVPKKEDYEKMGTQLLSNQRDPTKSTVFGLFPNRTTPLFEQSLPDQMMEEFKNDPRWGGREPSAAEIEQFRRSYIRQQYQKLFGAPKPEQPRPQVPQSK